MTDADALVIGGGHNGLVCAQRLASAGLSVIVLERRDEVGGMADTFEFAPGFWASACAQYLYDFPTALMDELNLVSHGLTMDPRPLASVALASGHAPRVLGAMHCENLSDADTARWPVFRERMTQLASFIEHLKHHAPPRLHARERRDVLELAQLGLALRKLGREDMREFLRLVTSNIYDLLHEWFDDPILRGALAFDAVLGTHLGPRSPGSVLTFLHRFGRGAGPCQPIGGMGAFSAALAASARAAGVSIRTQKTVRHIVMENGRAVGVRLDDDQTLRARHVISNADPKNTLLKLVGARHLDIGFARRVRHVRARGTSARLHLALDALPPAPLGRDELLRQRVVIAADPDDLERAFNPIKYGDASTRPALELCVPTLADPALAPDGHHVVSITAQYVPYQPAHGWSPAARDAFAEAHSDRRRCGVAGAAPAHRGTPAAGAGRHRGALRCNRRPLASRRAVARSVLVHTTGGVRCALRATRGRRVSLLGRRSSRRACERPRGTAGCTGCSPCRTGRSPVTRSGIDIRIRSTPFHARTQEACLINRWHAWQGFTVADAYVDAELEYFAVRNATGVFDLSPMTKYRISGPDAGDYLNRLVTRDMTRVRAGRVAYVVWCDDAGKVIDDGTVFHLGDGDYRLCSQEYHLEWLLAAADGFNVRVVDETDDVAALAVQGPTSCAALRAAGLDDLHTLKPFGLRQQTVDDVALTVSRTGFTGDLGYELWVPPEHALWLWDRLFAAGRAYGIRPIGGDALQMARIEAGFIQAGCDFLPADRVVRPGRARSPYELGLDWLVHLDKPHFSGRDALAREHREGSKWSLMRLLVDGNKPARDAYLYARGKKPVGFVTSALWSPVAKQNIALGTVERALVKGELRAEIFYQREMHWSRVMADCESVQGPFFDPARRRATPAGDL